MNAHKLLFLIKQPNLEGKTPIKTCPLCTTPSRKFNLDLYSQSSALTGVKTSGVWGQSGCHLLRWSHSQVAPFPGGSQLTGGAQRGWGSSGTIMEPSPRSSPRDSIPAPGCAGPDPRTGGSYRAAAAAPGGHTGPAGLWPGPPSSRGRSRSVSEPAAEVCLRSKSLGKPARGGRGRTGAATC